MSKERKENICFHCTEACHWKRDCPKLNSEGKGKNPVSGTASVGVSLKTIESDSDDGNVLMASADDETGISWMMNLGCSFHMTPHKSWFPTYTPRAGGSILMENNMVCKSVGMGTVRIKMFDGMVRTLTKVRHVPNLRKSLISMGALTRIGCNWIGQGDTLKVSKGTLTVIKAKKIQNLYALQRHTILSEAGVSEVSGCEGSARLWHFRLGHPGEKSLDVLRKREFIDIKKGSLEFCEKCVEGKLKKTSFGTG